MEPNFFIVGAPKCGTTSLYSWLSRHRRVFMSVMKEPHFYSNDICRRRKVKHQTEYRSLFSKATTKHKAIGEASTTYLQSRTAVKRIEENHNEPKYIILVRNPVNMARSLHNHLVSTGAEHILDFEKAWEMSNERREGKSINSVPIAPKVLDYKQTCRLGGQIERFLKHVDRERVHVTLLDDIKKNPKNEYKNVLRHLGLEYDGYESFEKKNRSKKRKYLSLQRVIRHVGNFSRDFKRLVGIPTHIGTGITKKIIDWNTVISEKPDIEKSLHEKITQHYKKDIKKLEVILDRDLTEWCS